MGLDWGLDPQHQFRQRFITALENDGSGLAAANRVYDKRYAQGPILDDDTSRPHWGCFPLGYQPEAAFYALYGKDRFE